MAMRKKTATEPTPEITGEEAVADSNDEESVAASARYSARALVDIQFEGPNGIAIIRKGRRFSSDSIPFDPEQMELL